MSQIFKQLNNIDYNAFNTLNLVIIEIAGIQDLDSIIYICWKYKNFILMAPQLRKNYK